MRNRIKTREKQERTTRQELKTFDARLTPLLQQFFDEEANAVPPAAKDMVTRLRKFCLRGGKRLRPYLTHTSYQLFGGKNENSALAMSIVPELIHNFLLIHDDVMDQSNIRRGEPTMHKVYEADIAGDNAAHFGESMAILSGDLLYTLAGQAINKVPVTPDKKWRIWQITQHAVRQTIFGQELDLQQSQQKKVASDETLTMYQYKTAYYSFDAPLRIGAVLANAKENDIEWISEYAIPCGIAFQLIDDALDGETQLPARELAQTYITQAQNALAEFTGDHFDQEAKQKLSALADFVAKRER